MISRCLRLRCPRCGAGKLFAGWFHMHPQCASCGLPFDRGPGFYLGAIYVNYGLTSLLVIVIYFSLYFAEVMTSGQLLILLFVFTLLFPLWFFRYARALWLGLDEYLDPTEEDAGAEPGARKYERSE